MKYYLIILFTLIVSVDAAEHMEEESKPTYNPNWLVSYSFRPQYASFRTQSAVFKQHNPIILTEYATKKVQI